MAVTLKKEFETDMTKASGLSEDASLSTVIGGVISDLQELVRKELAIVRVDIVAEVEEKKSEGKRWALAMGSAAAAAIWLSISAVAVLFEAAKLPLWASSLIVGGLFTVMAITFKAAQVKTTTDNLNSGFGKKDEDKA